MKSVKYLLFVFGLFCFSLVNAQVATLRIDSNSLSGLPDTVNVGSSYTLSVTLYNDSSTEFIGFISFKGNLGIDTGIIADTLPTSTLYYPRASTPDTVPAGGGVTRTLIVNVNNPPFIIGSSGVVIWPIAQATSGNLIVKIPDSVSKAITVLYPVGIDEIAARNLKVYTNGEQLMIQNNGRYLLKSMKLYDVAGNLLLQQSMSQSGSVDMSRFAAGAYFAEINFADNTRAVVKIVNTR